MHTNHGIYRASQSIKKHDLTCSGYMPPEYVRQGVFSTKLDVYSYGVLVLEIVTGRKNSGFHASENAPDLLTYVSTDTIT